MSFPFAEVARAIQGLERSLNCTVDAQLQAEFNAGLHPNLLTYSYGKSKARRLSPLTVYLIGAKSYISQPSNYYDIYGAGRSVLMVMMVNAALRVLSDHQCNGLARRLDRLKSAPDLEKFDSAAFEIITAGRYMMTRGVDAVEFIDETPSNRTADLSIRFENSGFLVECKKLNRVRDFSATTRNVVRELLLGVISEFRKRGESILGEVDFHCDPSNVKKSDLVQAFDAGFAEHTASISSQFTVKVSKLARYAGGSCTLYPSPHFAWSRYGYRVRGEWFGVVSDLYGRPARLAGLPKELQGGMSTWIDEIEWDAAVKWKITAEDVVAKYRRFPFTGLLNDALAQIGTGGPDSTVHIWIETDHFLQNRRDVLLDFFERLSSRPVQPVGWIVFNESLIDVSPQGHFDLIEHAHMIQGPTASSAEPIVAGVFGTPESASPTGEFGVGRAFPDIDQ